MQLYVKAQAAATSFGGTIPNYFGGGSHGTRSSGTDSSTSNTPPPSSCVILHCEILYRQSYATVLCSPKYWIVLPWRTVFVGHVTA